MEVYKGYMLYSNCELIPDIQSILSSEYVLGVSPNRDDDCSGIKYIKEYIDTATESCQHIVKIVKPHAVCIECRQHITWSKSGIFYTVYFTDEKNDDENYKVVNCIAVPLNNNPTVKEDKTMGNVNESFKTIMSMKMLSAIMKDDKQDLGKLFLMQQMMNGETITVTDVIKSKLIKQFDLSDDKELPIEKVMLLQMLDGGSIDLSQLLQYKMMSTFLSSEGDSLLEL